MPYLPQPYGPRALPYTDWPRDVDTSKVELLGTYANLSSAEARALVRSACSFDRLPHAGGRRQRQTEQTGQGRENNCTGSTDTDRRTYIKAYHFPSQCANLPTSRTAESLAKWPT